MSKLFVGNLSFRLTEGALEMFVHECGIKLKDVKIIRDNVSGRSRGFGFVELADDQDVEEAISMLDGKNLEGRALRVNRAQERRGGGPRGPSRRPDSSPPGGDEY